MKLRINNLLPLLIVLFLAGLTLWLRYSVEQSGPERAPATRHDPDAIVDNFRLVRLGTSGKPQHSMSARRMVHYPDTDATELERPRFLKRGADGATLTVTSDRASISPDAGEARFTGNVLLRREATRDRPTLVAETDFLHLMADKDLAQTDRRITIREGSRVLTGVGMEMNRRTHQIVLHSQVKGTFDGIRRK